jgi:hypothetical protein
MCLAIGLSGESRYQQATRTQFLIPLKSYEFFTEPQYSHRHFELLLLSWLDEFLYSSQLEKHGKESDIPKPDISDDIVVGNEGGTRTLQAGRTGRTGTSTAVVLQLRHLTRHLSLSTQSV